MDTVSLKKYAFENNKIEHILAALNCHKIAYCVNGDYYSAAFPDGDNPKGVNISNNEYLGYWSWSRSVSSADGNDIFDLIQYVDKCSFVESVKRLHNILGLEYSRYKREAKKEEKKIDPLWIFKKIKLARKKFDVREIQVLDESVLEEYVPILHIDWFKDCIMPWAKDKFGLMYSYRRKRVIIPHRYWMTGELLGANMRSTVQNCEELGIPKYILTKGMDKSVNLYGLYENYNSIQEAGYVVVYEAEKSVLKMYSKDGHESDKWKYGFNGKTGVALSGKTISDEQAAILMGLNVEIVLAMDKDVPIEDVRALCEKFYWCRKVSYIYDKDGLLNSKDSPADTSNKNFDVLFKQRVRYGSSEHAKYLKSLDDKD